MALPTGGDKAVHQKVEKGRRGEEGILLCNGVVMGWWERLSGPCLASLHQQLPEIRPPLQPFLMHHSSFFPPC